MDLRLSMKGEAHLLVETPSPDIAAGGRHAKGTNASGAKFVQDAANKVLRNATPADAGLHGDRDKLGGGEPW